MGIAKPRRRWHDRQEEPMSNYQLLIDGQLVDGAQATHREIRRPRRRSRCAHAHQRRNSIKRLRPPRRRSLHGRRPRSSSAGAAVNKDRRHHAGAHRRTGASVDDRNRASRCPTWTSCTAQSRSSATWPLLDLPMRGATRRALIAGSIGSITRPFGVVVRSALELPAHCSSRSRWPRR